MEDGRVPDRARIEAALGGDAEAFGELVRRYQAMVAGVAWRFGVGPADVEDVVSEIFIKTHQNLDRYRPSHPFSTWLYRVAVNHVLDHLRRQRKEHGRTDMPEQVADGAPGPAVETLRRERAAELRAALADLPPRYREALTVVYLEGHSISEAAALLSLPTGTVKTRLMRGRQALKKILLRRRPGAFEATS